MHDGDPATWWDCAAPQKGGEQFEVDLGRPTQVAAVVTALGVNVANFPRQLVVETSVDGAEWAPAWDAHVVVATILAGQRDPKNPRIIVAFEPREARYVRLRQTLNHDQFFWSVSELEIYSAARLPSRLERRRVVKGPRYRFQVRVHGSRGPGCARPRRRANRQR